MLSIREVLYRFQIYWLSSVRQAHRVNCFLLMFLFRENKDFVLPQEICDIFRQLDPRGRGTLSFREFFTGVRQILRLRQNESHYISSKGKLCLKLLKSLHFLNRIIALLFNYEIHNGFVNFNYNSGTVDFCSHVAVFITTVLYYYCKNLQ